MKILAIVALGLAAAGAGAGGVYVADKLYWDNQLSVQMAERDKMIADLNSDLTGLRTGLSSLKETNTAMRGLIDASLKDTADVARSNKTSVEKLRAIIVSLEQLQTALRATGAQP